jgi:hypothetical protein
MNKTLIPVFLACIAVFLSACQKEPDITLPVSPGAINDKTVTATFNGIVVDPSGKPLLNVKITSGNEVTSTGAYGFFRLKNIESSEQFGHIKAEKTGYFPGSRTVYTDASSSNFVVIQLIERELAGTLENGSGTITIDEGVTVSFNQSAFVTAAGDAYTGSVNVYASFLDPESRDFTRIMPGDLRGITSTNEVTALLSYGMLAVELEGTSGEQLQLASGNKATIRTAIPPSLLAKAPSSMPLWFFDENVGLWKEEGAATRDGNFYTGEVSHFTYWNYDDPLAFVYLSLELQNNDDESLPYTYLKIVDKSNGSYGAGYTDSTGKLKLWVPKGAPLEINVQNECRETYFTTTVGPYTNDADLGILHVTVPQSATIEITGTAVDCMGDPLKNGFANIYLNGLNYAAEITDGHFNRKIERCSDLATTASIYILDRDAQKESVHKDVGVTSGTYNAGEFTTCEQSSDQYVNMTIGNDQYSLTFPPDTLSIFRSDKTTSFNFSQAPFDVNSPRIYFTAADTVPYTGETSCDVRVNQEAYSGDSMTLVVSKYGRVNDFIEMTITGNVIANDSSGVVLPFSADLRIRRKN